MTGQTLTQRTESGRELPLEVKRFELERGRIVRLEELPKEKWIIFDFQGENSELAYLDVCRDQNCIPTLRRDDGEIRLSLYEIFQGNIITRKPQHYKIIDKKSEEHDLYEQVLQEARL